MIGRENAAATASAANRGPQAVRASGIAGDLAMSNLLRAARMDSPAVPNVRARMKFHTPFTVAAAAAARCRSAREEPVCRRERSRYAGPGTPGKVPRWRPEVLP